MSTPTTEELYRTEIAGGFNVAISATHVRPIEFPNANGIRSTEKANEQEELKASLPTMATANDVREVVQYLKRHPGGVNICDIVQPIKKRIFYPAKVVAYESWGLVTRKGERVTLTSIGWEFARSIEPEARAYRALVDRTKLYRAALHWVHDQGLDLVTTDDIASYWLARFSAVFGADQDAHLEKTVVSFFHVCQAAELGTMTIGKRGQPARLRVWRVALAEYVESHSNGASLTFAEGSEVGVVVRDRRPEERFLQIRD